MGCCIHEEQAKPRVRARLCLLTLSQNDLHKSAWPINRRQNASVCFLPVHRGKNDAQVHLVRNMELAAAEPLGNGKARDAGRYPKAGRHRSHAQDKLGMKKTLSSRRALEPRAGLSVE